MIQMNLLINQKETHRLRKRTHGCRRRGIVRDLGKAMHPLLYLKWVTNKDMEISTLYASLVGREVWGRVGSCV